MAVQTPKQKLANQKWAKKNVKKQGSKDRSKKVNVEYPVSKFWLWTLLFLVCGGAVLEIMRQFF